MKSEGKTLFEIYQLNGCRYPFWVTSWRPVHYVALVKDFGYFSSRIWRRFDVNQVTYRQFPRNGFLCDLYSLDKLHCEKRDVFIPGHNQPDWQLA
jgi:hypothetical protein